MSRNRVRNSNSLHLTTVLKVVLMVSLIASLGLSYIFLDNRQKRLANEISKQEIQL
jgi:preprotein translocase subunit SecY